MEPPPAPVSTVGPGPIGREKKMGLGGAVGQGGSPLPHLHSLHSHCKHFSPASQTPSAPPTDDQIKEFGNYLINMSSQV